MSSEWPMAALWTVLLARTARRPWRARTWLMRLTSTLRAGVRAAVATAGWVAVTATRAAAMTASRVSMPLSVGMPARPCDPQAGPSWLPATNRTASPERRRHAYGLSRRRRRRARRRRGVGVGIGELDGAERRLRPEPRMDPPRELAQGRERLGAVPVVPVEDAAAQVDG